MLKKLISRLFPEAPLHKMPFWQGLERREKIRRLDSILFEIKKEQHNAFVDKSGDLEFYKNTTNRLLALAHEQQQLLSKK
jgi:hypothetical protein